MNAGEIASRFPVSHPRKAASLSWKVSNMAEPGTAKPDNFALG